MEREDFVPLLDALDRRLERLERPVLDGTEHERPLVQQVPLNRAEIQALRDMIDQHRADTSRTESTTDDKGWLSKLADRVLTAARERPVTFLFVCILLLLIGTFSVTGILAWRGTTLAEFLGFADPIERVADEVDALEDAMGPPPRYPEPGGYEGGYTPRQPYGTPYEGSPYSPPAPGRDL